MLQVEHSFQCKLPAIHKSGSKTFTLKFDKSNTAFPESAELNIELEESCADAVQDDNAKLDLTLNLKFKYDYKVKKYQDNAKNAYASSIKPSLNNLFRRYPCLLWERRRSKSSTIRLTKDSNMCSRSPTRGRVHKINQSSSQLLFPTLSWSQ